MPSASRLFYLAVFALLGTANGSASDDLVSSQVESTVPSQCLVSYFEHDDTDLY